jgi:hypothetical protein
MWWPDKLLEFPFGLLKNLLVKVKDQVYQIGDKL